MTISDETTTLDGGSYDVIRRRLLDQVAELASKAEQLNARRKQVFGGRELALIANERVRTENNCTPRDIVSVSGHLLFGFTVFIGLKTETTVADVFSLHRFEKRDDGYDLAAVPFEGPGAFLADGAFGKEFRDVFKYMKDAHLSQLRRTETRLLCSVRVGTSVRDVKVFRWAIDATGRLAYMDARGDEDYTPPRSHDFEWTVTTRENHVSGPNPHVNILNEVFVETVGGDLTVKVENNTRDGKGIYREPVDDANQTLDDSNISYAKVGTLILIRVKPFREEKFRYLVYNTRTHNVRRIDAIGLACLSLPEDHGIVFPGGYYLQAGDSKVFEGDVTEMEFEAVHASPNGEDVLYVFYRHDDGQYVLMPYNLIRKEVQTPVRCHGYSLFADGTMAVFRADNPEPTRVHPIQIWQTPYTTAEFAASAPTDGSYLAKVGNADLVRGISDALSLQRLARTESPSRRTYEDLIAATQRMSDAYYWLGHAEAFELLATIQSIRKTANLVVDEFEKVIAIQKRAQEAVTTAETTQRDLLGKVRVDDIKSVEGFLSALTGLRGQRGQLITLKELRSVDLARVAKLEEEVVAHFDAVSKACIAFLLGDGAFKPLLDRLDAFVGKVESVPKASELIPFGEDLDGVQTGLTLLSEVVGGLKIDDATARTRILEGISTAFSQLNRARATFQGRKKDLSLREGRAEFAAQFKLFGQSVTSALAVCDTPERCDEQLSKLLVQLEDLEGRFGELDEFLGDLTTKRQEVNDAVGARRQTLVDERQRRAQNVASAATRILAGVSRRALSFKTTDELNAYFASDAMVQKLNELHAQLVTLGDSVRADEVQSRLKSARQDALRALRDRTDLYEAGDSVIKLGAHRFSVQQKPLEITLLPREGDMALHLTGTDFYEKIDDSALNEARDLWDQTLVSETNEVYRSEFLAAAMLFDAENGANGLSVSSLQRSAVDPAALLETVRTYAERRLDEGYERGIHDADAALILEKLLALRSSAGKLRFASDARACACLFWADLQTDARELLLRRARSLGRLRKELGDAHGQNALAQEIETPLRAFLDLRHSGPVDVRAACLYLVEELAEDSVRFVTSAEASKLRDSLLADLEQRSARRPFEDDLRALEKHPFERLQLARAYIDSFIAAQKLEPSAPFSREAATLMITDHKLDRVVSAASTRVDVTGLLGQHPRIESRTMHLALDEFLVRVGAFHRERAPRFRQYRQVRTAILERERNRLRLDEFTPRVLTSFVRNRLIDEVYLPLIGANLAKQIGAVGDKKRTDLMGLLLLISPPGYGKTTLMEYVASKLGLIFMKVNGPALGHEVTSLDPTEAKNATARQEVQKINLALEMGNNVMLYLDDIQHTSAELLQKFISLCDAQRRIEGVWNGRTRTYDLRGKKFCIVMAGNPYTESGTRFQIPDMLANRADTYNLGDILEGKDDLFALSYLENALTSNSVLAPLAGRDATDVHKLIRMAKGEEIVLTDLSYGYSSAEVQEISEIFRRLFKVQATLLAVNMQYIASASQDDAFRSEPGFKLQGSYRNMNKLAEKVVAAMNDDEIERLVDDHYAGESQTLTTGAEQNLLKLAEIRNRMSAEQITRWNAIKESYQRNKRMGGKADDPVARLTGTLSGLDVQLQGIRETIGKAAEGRGATEALGPRIEAVTAALTALLQTARTPAAPIATESTSTNAITDLLGQQVSLVERALLPLVRAVTDGHAARGESYSSDVAERMSGLESMLRKLDDGLQQTAMRPARFDVDLSADSDSNFFCGLSGDDVVVHGGIFVSTYSQLPGIGARVALNLSFPGANSVSEVVGIVVFRQQLAEGDTELRPGFGARITQISAPTRTLIAEYVRLRPAMMRE